MSKEEGDGPRIPDKKQLKAAVKPVSDVAPRIEPGADSRELVRSLLEHVRNWTGCEAAGVRLREGRGYACFEVQGSPAHFLATENHYGALGEEGTPVCDASGDPLVEGTRDNVLQGRFDSALPFFTARGSYWTAGATDLLSDATEADRPAPPLNRSLSEGYGSVALIPLRSGGEIFGLLQLNDKERGRFTPETIALLEQMADTVAGPLAERLAREALKESEERYRVLVEATSDLIFSLDRNLRVTATNTAAALAFGTTVADVPGTKLSELQLPEDTRRRWELECREVLLSGRPATGLRNEFPLAEGKACTKETDLAPIWGPLGTVVGIRGAARDITERKRNEEALTESERRFRAVFENAAIGVAICDAEGRALKSNPALQKMLGYSATELARLTFAELTHPEDVASELRLFQELMAGKRDHYQLEKRFLHKSSEAIWVQMTGSLLGGDRGEPPFGIGIVVDISERKLAEEALHESEDQLRQAQKMEVVGRLAGGIAHDFNNVLTAILGYSDLILSSEECTSSLRGDIGEIKTAAERASALTRQILAFSRRQALQPEVLSLNSTLAGIERLLARTLGDDISLVTRLHTELGLVEVDAHQFEQVLFDLALNARDAMPTGGKLTVETANVEVDEDYCRSHAGIEPGAYVMLAVSDTGVGMDEETKSHVFEPFFTTKEPGKGTGLGMATVYGIVKQSGGGVFVYSELGKGTTFKIYLPRIDKPGVKRIIAAPTPPSVAGGETILVVEDEAALRNLVGRILGRLGYTILAAASGDEGLVLLETADPPVDLLLTDVVLPGSLQGNELSQAALALHPHLPVLYMSGYTRDAIVHSGRLDEGVNYIEKPFTPEGLANRVREVLDSLTSTQ